METVLSTAAAASATDAAWPNRFAALGTSFYTRLDPEPVPQPHWVVRSENCAALLGWPGDWADAPAALQVFGGNALAPGMQPLASVYSGHQFGVWAGQLGDGRALWLGETVTPAGPLEVQLKGAGRTPYSRSGDGRAVLRSSIREFLCSEAMHALGVPTTRALCVVGSPLPVWRETRETAAVLTRVAPSFIRFGHFEHFSNDDSARPGAAQQESHADLRRLADFAVEHHFPACRDAANPYLALLEATARRTASLMAAWQSIGFCHGVMNTDNMSMLGLTIDYGPFGFLDRFDPGHICNHSDHQGRYAWARQPNVAFWNLHALAQALLPLIGDGDAALAALEPYKSVYAEAALARWRAKLGLATAHDDDQALVDDLLRLMAADGCDFTITFRRLGDFATAPVPGPGSSSGTGGPVVAPIRDLFIDRAAFDAWAIRYAARLANEGSADGERRLRMHRANPKYILRNHLAEVAIREAQAGDFTATRRLHQVLCRPFDEQDAATAERYAGFPPDWAQSIEVSCSS